MNKNKIIFELWRLLDNIDTAEDSCKGNLEQYEKIVHKNQIKRHSLVSKKKIEKLYDKYFKWK